MDPCFYTRSHYDDKERACWLPVSLNIFHMHPVWPHLHSTVRVKTCSFFLWSSYAVAFCLVHRRDDYKYTYLLNRAEFWNCSPISTANFRFYLWRSIIIIIYYKPSRNGFLRVFTWIWLYFRVGMGRGVAGFHDFKISLKKKFALTLMSFSQKYSDGQLFFADFFARSKRKIC